MYTIVTTFGEVLQHGTQGVQIVNVDGRELMQIDEVSDDKAINVFVKTTETFHPMSGPDEGSYEICIDR